MRTIYKVILLSIAGIYSLAGCGGKQIDIGAVSVTQQDTETVNVSQQCMYLYSQKKWEVAIVEFSNNTGYGNMNVRNKNSKTRGVTVTDSVSSRVAVGNRYSSASVGSQSSVSESMYSTNSSEFMGQFAPSLGSFAQGVVEEAVVQMGGVTVYSRADLEKILAEQQFQMTIANPDTIMEFGKLSGVRLILTGSVDNIEASYVQPQNFNDTRSDVGTLLTLSMMALDSATAGWYVKMQFTIKLLDAETGKVLFSKTMSDKTRASQNTNFQPDIIINAAKGLMSKSVSGISNELMPLFALTSYINEIRGGKQIAQINSGAEAGIRKGDTLDIFDVVSTQDFLTKETKCSLVKTPAKIIIGEVSAESAWGYLKGGKEPLSKVKIGSIVQRTQLGSK